MHRETRLFDELDTFAQQGRITHVLALTYGYDGDFVYERLWRLLLERYGVRHPLVVADGTMFGRDASEVGAGRVSSGNALGAHVVRAARRGNGVFHPKLFVAVREDAVLIAVGSANLTRGGLGANLELATVLTFTRAEASKAPVAILRDVVSFLRESVRLRIEGNVHAKSLEVFDDVVKHASLAAAEITEADSVANLSFVHSATTPLWKQILALHGSDPLEHLLVVSPFYEQEDPEADASEGFLGSIANSETLWADGAAEPRIRLLAGENSAIAGVPRHAVEALGEAVQVHMQLTSEEPRRLHGKLFVLAGRTQTTAVWGSPNFTRAALAKTCDDAVSGQAGNVECALVLRAPADELRLDTFERNFNLRSLFKRATELPDAPPVGAILVPAINLGEIAYDPARHELSFHGEVISSEVAWLQISPVDGKTPPFLIAVNAAGAFNATWEAASLEEEDPATGRRRLRDLFVVVVALDADGNALERIRARINVVFDDAIEVHQNLLLGPAALSADVLLVPSSAPAERRIAAIDGWLRRLRDARAQGAGQVSQHQASLDSFQRNVRKGLDARWRQVEAAKGTRFVVSRWSADLRRALAAATMDAVDEPRRAFLLLRVSEHMDKVLSALSGWGHPEGTLREVLDATKLREALAGVTLAADGDPLFAPALTVRERVVSKLEVLP